MSEQNKTVIRFVKDPNYRRFYAFGFWGGVNPLGEVAIEIFEDAVDTPETLEITYDENGNQHEERFPERQDVLRIVHAGVIMPIEIVPSIIDWLQRKLMEYEEMKKRQPIS